MIGRKLFGFTAFLMSFALVAGDLSVFAQRGGERGRGAERSQQARGNSGQARGQETRQAQNNRGNRESRQPQVRNNPQPRQEQTRGNSRGRQRQEQVRSIPQALPQQRPEQPRGTSRDRQRQAWGIPQANPQQRQSDARARQQQRQSDARSRQQQARSDRQSQIQQRQSDARARQQQRQSDARSRQQQVWNDRQAQRQVRSDRRDRAPQIVPFGGARQRGVQDRAARTARQRQPVVVSSQDVWYEDRRSQRGRDRRGVGRRSAGGPPPWAGVWNTPAPWVSNAPWSYNNQVSSRNVWRDRRTQSTVIWDDRRWDPNRTRWFESSARNHRTSWMIPDIPWSFYEPAPTFISVQRPIHVMHVSHSPIFGRVDPFYSNVFYDDPYYGDPYYGDAYYGDPYYNDPYYYGGGSPLGGLFGGFGDPYAHGGQNFFGGGIWDILLQTALGIFMGGSNYGYLDQQPMYAAYPGYGYSHQPVYSFATAPAFVANQPYGYSPMYVSDPFYDPYGPQFIPATFYSEPYYGYGEPLAFVTPSNMIGETIVTGHYHCPRTAFLLN